jgi:hypothetical protein
LFLSLSARCSKRFRGPAALARTAGLLFLLVRPGLPQLVDCIAAEVNSQIITLTDLRVLRAFAITLPGFREESPSPVRQILEDAIDQKVVISLVRENVSVSQQEVDGMLDELKKTFTLSEWQRKLDAFGLQPADLKPYLREKKTYERIISLRFGQSVDVNLEEIEKYYDDVYAPSQRAQGKEPEPMVEVLPSIETRIRREKTDQQVTSWIRSLRGQADIRINSECLQRIE